MDHFRHDTSRPVALTAFRQDAACTGFPVCQAADGASRPITKGDRAGDRENPGMPGRVAEVCVAHIKVMMIFAGGQEGVVQFSAAAAERDLIVLCEAGAGGGH
jgi:hypothetical protein